MVPTRGFTNSNHIEQDEGWKANVAHYLTVPKSNMHLTSFCILVFTRTPFMYNSSVTNRPTHHSVLTSELLSFSRSVQIKHFIEKVGVLYCTLHVACCVIVMPWPFFLQSVTNIYCYFSFSQSTEHFVQKLPARV